MLIHFTNLDGTERFSSEERDDLPCVGDRTRLEDGWEYEICQIESGITVNQGRDNWKTWAVVRAKRLKVQSAWPASYLQ